MFKQKVVSTSMGQLTVSSLTLGELRQLDPLLTETTADKGSKGLGSVLKLLPVVLSSLRKVHQDLSLDTLENGLTLEDFTTLLNAVLEVSGLKQAAAGEGSPVTV